MSRKVLTLFSFLFIRRQSCVQFIWKGFLSRRLNMATIQMFRENLCLSWEWVHQELLTPWLCKDEAASCCDFGKMTVAPL